MASPREEGVWIKHGLNTNSVKAYKTVGSVLRVETTVNNVRDLKAYRPPAGNPDGQPTWQRMRKGISDLYRRAEVSHAATGRYLDAMAAVGQTGAPEQSRQKGLPTHHMERTVRSRFEGFGTGKSANCSMAQTRGTRTKPIADPAG